MDHFCISLFHEAIAWERSVSGQSCTMRWAPLRFGRTTERRWKANTTPTVAGAQEMKLLFVTVFLMTQIAKRKRWRCCGRAHGGSRFASRKFHVVVVAAT